MKKIVTGKELYEKMQEAINLLCDTVKTTLGPKGTNAIIDHSSFRPFITNDGVTIAENIESDDPIINTILELAKEASIKTNEDVGDGTTTTLVLLQSIFNQGLDLIKNGKNPIMLKQEINDAIPNIINKINEKSRIPTKEELYNIACISGKDKMIGKLVSEAFYKTKSKDAINIAEHNQEESKLIFNKGYSFLTNTSPYFFYETNEIKIQKPYVLLIDNILLNLNDIAIILNKIISNNESLIIIANDYSDEVLNEIVSLHEQNINIILEKSPEYAKKQQQVLNDLAVISNATLVKNSEETSLNNLGQVKCIKINKDNTLIEFSFNEQCKKRIKDIKNELAKEEDNFEQDFYLKRLAMLECGLATILVGAPTNFERREKKMHFDDALWACDAASKGITLGSGITFMQIHESIFSKTDGEDILKESLKMPFEQIIYNSAIKEEIVLEIKESKYSKLYNINLNKVEDTKNTLVIDPTKVLINSFVNACSISSLLLSTTSLIINEHQNNLNKINDYNEL